MKKILILLFSILISLNSYGEWTKINDDTEGSGYFIDLDAVIKHDGYVYFWRLKNYLKPTEWGDLSTKVYREGDCSLKRFKHLSYIWYKQPMGILESDSNTPTDPKWEYPDPDSIGYRLLNYVCDYVN